VDEAPKPLKEGVCEGRSGRYHQEAAGSRRRSRGQLGFLSSGCQGTAKRAFVAPPGRPQTEGEPTPGSWCGVSACAKRIRLLNYKAVELLAPARTALVLLRRRFIAIISTAKANLAALVERLFPQVARPTIANSPIPNLIEIQKKSYERFLQMDRLTPERFLRTRATPGCRRSSSPSSRSAISAEASLEFVEYSIGNWECKCGKLRGLHHLRSPCTHCGATIKPTPTVTGEVLCPQCGEFNETAATFCDICGDPVGLKLKYDVDECQERGMTYAVPAQGHHPARRLRTRTPRPASRRSATSRSRRSSSATSR
jgi:hypothetical protein